MRIINEPADAAMACGFGMETNYNGENSLLIFYLGGGIFIEELIVEGRGTTGDSHLRDDDFDNGLVNLFVQSVENCL